MEHKANRKSQIKLPIWQTEDRKVRLRGKSLQRWLANALAGGYTLRRTIFAFGCALSHNAEVPARAGRIRTGKLVCDIAYNARRDSPERAGPVEEVGRAYRRRREYLERMLLRR